MSPVTTWNRFITVSVVLGMLTLTTAGQVWEDPLADGDSPPNAVPAGAELIPLPPAGDPEPNDTLATAVETGLIDEGEVTVVAALLGDGDFPERDVDLFRFEIPPEGWLPKLLTVSASATSSLDGYLRVFDASGQEIANNDDQAYPDTDPWLRTYLLATGVYYVGVSSSGHAYYDPLEADTGADNPTDGEYDLTIAVEGVPPPSGDLEPNDDFATATDLYLIDAVLGQFIGDGPLERSDIDVYGIPLLQPGIIEADALAESLNSPLDPVLSLFTTDGMIASNDNADLSTYDARLEVPVYSAGYYYLVVSGAGNDQRVLDPLLAISGSVGYYDLYVTTTPLDEPGGPFESNDSILEATPVALAGPGEVTLSAHVGDGKFGETRGDVDVFEVRASEGATVIVDVDAAVAGSELDSLVVVFDYLGRVLGANDNDGQTTDSFLAVDVPHYWWWPPEGGDPPGDLTPMVYVMIMGTRQARPPDPMVPNPDPPGSSSFQRSEFGLVDVVSSTGPYEVSFAIDNCCITGHGTGCGHPAIEACVCAIDPYCCEVDWDEFCVEEVTSGGCGFCPAGPGHNCCEIGHGAGCSDPDIEACVCEVEPSCCEEVWDDSCVYLAYRPYLHGGVGCANCPHDCCEPGGPGCTDPAVRACVCAEYPDCCEEAWDEGCVWWLATHSDCGSCPPGSWSRGDAGTAQPAGSTWTESQTQRIVATSFDLPPDAIIEIDPHDGSVIDRHDVPEQIARAGNGLTLLDDTLFYLGQGRFPRLYWLDAETGDILDKTILWSGSGYYGDLATLDGSIYVSDILEHSLYELDPQALQALRTLDVGATNDITLSGPIAGLACPDALYVADAVGSGAVYAIDPTTGYLDESLSLSLPCPCNADFDGDGDVDGDDAAFFEDCETGDDSVPYGCQPVDLDCDDDRDEYDQAILECQYNGPGQPPHDDCCPPDLPPVPVRATALGGSGHARLYLSDWLDQSIEVYSRTGTLLDTFPMQTAIGALGGEPFVVFADGDGDGDIDLHDHVAFIDCMSGPGEPAAPSCCMFDVEPDGDVDLDDFADLQIALAQGI